MSRLNKDVHRIRYELIKNFVNFRIDFRKKLTEYQKRQIKKYYDYVVRKKREGGRVYSPRSQSAKKEASKPTKKELPFLRKFFVRASEKAKIKFDERKGTISVKEKYIESDSYIFNTDKNSKSFKEWMLNPSNFIRKIIEKLIKRFNPKDYIVYSFITERGEEHTTKDKDLLIKAFGYIVEKYVHYGKAMFVYGIKLTRFKNQETPPTEFLKKLAKFKHKKKEVDYLDEEQQQKLKLINEIAKKKRELDEIVKQLNELKRK